MLLQTGVGIEYWLCQQLQQNCHSEVNWEFLENRELNIN